MTDAKRYFAVEEMHDVADVCGVTHWIIAKDMNDLLVILADADLGDAVKLAIVELSAEEAATLRVHDGLHADLFKLTEGPLGALYSEEF